MSKLLDRPHTPLDILEHREYVDIDAPNGEFARDYATLFFLNVHDYIPVTSAALLECRQRLRDLRGLSAGWYNGNGLVIDALAISAAQQFLLARPALCESYRIYPTEKAGILFEFDASGWDFSVEFHPGGSVEMYGIEIEGPGEMELRKFDALNGDFLRTFDDRIKP